MGGPISLHRYRSFKKTKLEQRADRIEILAEQPQLPKAALEEVPELNNPVQPTALPAQAFADPDPFRELTFPGTVAAKKASAGHLGLPPAKLPPEQLDFIDRLVAETLDRHEVMARVRGP